MPQMSRDELQLEVMMDPIVQNDPQAVQLVMRAMNEKIVRLRDTGVRVKTRLTHLNTDT